jgi:hypothetical protein
MDAVSSHHSFDQIFHAAGAGLRLVVGYRSVRRAHNVSTTASADFGAGGGQS